ncbi:MAG: hypothetical protein GC186_16720 [Rhodobacteraceae bacterium]|nr:hypothetical protein [Paracoccaceae bacterium]
MRLRSGLLNTGTILCLVVAILATFGLSRSFATEMTPAVPAWLTAHMGDGDDQIAPVVLQRARALYLQKVGAGAVSNPCYFAMDATRPNNLGDGGPGNRFYIICEASRTFRAISSGHGGGRILKGIADFSDDRQCAKNFSNAQGSYLTAGGAYVTAETKTGFKGYYRTSGKGTAILMRTFIQFDGEGETGNARPRAIGGHAAVLLRNACLLHDPGSPYATGDGYVPLGTLVNYAGGRSDGCTSWSPTDAQDIVGMVADDPTTLYIYPEAADINAVAHAVAAGRSLPGAGLYWNTACLKEIKAPKFWPKETLEPLIAQYDRDHPAPPPRPIPICPGQ